METGKNFVKDAFKKCQPELEFRFFGSNGKVIATISNLPELITALPEIPAIIAQFHVFRETTQDIFEDRQLDGPVVRSDLALWINYVLGDVELSRRIYELGKTEKNAKLLKEKVIKTLREREQELMNLVRPN
ncbi:MAG: DUF5752 family protein [Candidatus Hodarchaeales archaeon]